MADDPRDRLPRMLREPCEGPHGGVSEAVYALDLPNGVRLWLCWSCWVDRSRKAAADA